ncbi:MAG: hypothetical protein JWO85_3180 [Candidatus Eremiobacteraeota bacterium]|nr:hypothetical protein [Candidatus Eremiobacteraeota bacterium]
MKTTIVPNASSVGDATATQLVQTNGTHVADARIAKLMPIPPPVQSEALATGLHGAIGCDFIPSTNQLAFVEYAGNVSIVNLFLPLVATVSQGTQTITGTWAFDCETGALGGFNAASDIWWEQQTAMQRQMVPIGGAKIANLGHVDFNAVTTATLQSLSYGTVPITGNNDASNTLTNGDVFAVHTNAGNYSKIKVLSYGYDLHIQWVTYKVGQRYQVLGSGYTEPEDIIVGPDGRHAFVTERTGNVLRVDLSNASRAAAQVLASGLTAPHQMQFDGLHNHVYVVEYAPNGRLLRIDIGTGATTTVASGLDHPIGLLLAADEQSAYVTEQASGGGRLRRVDMGTGAVSDVVGGFTAPFMMSWLDPARERLALCERDPANRIAIVDLGNGNTVTRIAPGIGFRPSDLAVVAAHRALVTADTEIDDITFGLDPLTGPLYKGVGFVPFDRIDSVTGLANTWADVNYFFRVQNVPFGSVIPVKINHYLASIDGAAWYQILLDGIPRGDAWGDYKWNPITNRYDSLTISAQDIGPLHNVYPVRTLADLVLWYNSDLGSRVDTTGYVDGLHTIEVRFYNATFGAIAVAAPNGGPHTICFDNSRCFASLDSITLGGQSAGTDCGILKYVNLTDTVTLTYRASQAHASATYSFAVLRGAHEIAALDQSGNVGLPSYSESATVATLLGSCAGPGGPGTAGFLEELYVATRAINGEGRLSGYDASDARAFVLAQ